MMLFLIALLLSLICLYFEAAAGLGGLRMLLRPSGQLGRDRAPHCRLSSPSNLTEHFDRLDRLRLWQLRQNLQPSPALLSSQSTPHYPAQPKQGSRTWLSISLWNGSLS